jgi:DNA-binding MarR family transcriptional regulator
MDDASGEDLGRRLSTAIIAFHQAVADRVGLSAADHKALETIRREGPLGPGRLARLVGLNPSSTTALIDRLEAAGYVRRDPDTDDRRRRAITATVDQHPDIGEAYRSLATSMGKLMAGFSPAEQQVIHRYVTGTIDVLHDQTARLLDPTDG